jgi:hypothetical protein
MGAFVHTKFPDFRAICLGTTGPKLQNGHGAADKKFKLLIQT